MNRLLSLLLLGFAAPLLAGSGRPAWAEGTTPEGVATIVTIEAGSAQDLILLTGGLEQGLRDGMVLQGTDAVAEARLLIAAATADRSVALILNPASGRSLEPGDTFRRSLIRI